MNRSNLKDKGISVLVSLSFNALLLLFMIGLVPPVRVHRFRHAADVRITEPGLVFFPQTEGLPETQPSGMADGQISASEVSVGRGTNSDRIADEAGTVYPENLNMGQERNRGAGSFRIIPSPNSEGRFSLSLSNDNPEFQKLMEDDIHEHMGFSRFNESALSSLQFNRIITKKGGGASAAGLDTAMTDRLDGYDMTPWVKQVVDKIRNNWTPPPIEESIALGEVRILVVIGRGGDLVDLEILTSSDFQVFDLTTMAAIRASAPFPPLPDDFPLDRLEAFLVFEFHE